MTHDEIKSELERLERQGWDSLCDGTGSEFYGAMMTEDALMVLANGMTMDRDEVVEALSSAPTWDRYELADLRLVPIAGDAAALTYVGTAHRPSGPPVVAVMSSVYRRDLEGWKLALYQQTPAPSA
jgi:hypothetical protein